MMIRHLFDDKTKKKIKKIRFNHLKLVPNDPKNIQFFSTRGNLWLCINCTMVGVLPQFESTVISRQDYSILTSLVHQFVCCLLSGNGDEYFITIDEKDVDIYSSYCDRLSKNWQPQAKVAFEKVKEIYDRNLPT